MAVHLLNISDTSTDLRTQIPVADRQGAAQVENVGPEDVALRPGGQAGYAADVPSAATVTFTAPEGTVYPLGQKVKKAADPQTWSTTQAAVVPPGGTVDAPVVCDAPGPIAAAAGSLDTAVDPPAGHVSVANAAAAIPGHLAGTWEPPPASDKVLAPGDRYRIDLDSILGAVCEGGVGKLQLHSGVNRAEPTAQGLVQRHVLAAWSYEVAVDQATARAAAKAIPSLNLRSWQVRHRWSDGATGTGTLKLQYRTADGAWWKLGAIGLTDAPTVANGLSQLVTFPAPDGATEAAAIYEDFVDGTLTVQIVGLA